MHTFASIKVGEAFRFSTDPLKERCVKIDSYSYRMSNGGIYDARRVASGVSSLSGSAQVRRVK